jgi:hypothetical protein
VAAGDALLVCAYDDADRYERNKLEGSIPFSEFTQRVPSLGKDQEIIFFCA